MGRIVFGMFGMFGMFGDSVVGEWDCFDEFWDVLGCFDLF